MKKKSPNTLLPAGGYSRVDTLTAAIGCSKAYVYRMLREGDFPKPKKLSPRTTVWSNSEVLQWIEARTTDRLTQPEKLVNSNPKRRAAESESA